MSTHAHHVRDFFEQYARSRAAGDSQGIVSQYPDSFMVAGPKGARVAEKAAVLAAFPKGREFLRAHGHTSTEVLSLHETRLDDHYLLVQAQFAWRFEKPPAAAIDVTVDSTFVLYVSQDGFTIVFQQEHEDFQEVLRLSGVLPSKE